MRRKTLRKERFRAVLRPLLYVPGQKTYIFIVGCYNSGTTLLCDVLGRHPSIAVLPTEGAVLTEALKRPEDLGYTRMWHLCEQELKHINDNAEKIASRIKKDWHMWGGWKKPYLLEKSIINTARIQFFHEYFKPAYFIGVVRNGFAVCEGIRRRTLQSPLLDRTRFPDGYSLELCAQQWKRSNECLREATEKVAHFKLIQYEEFVENPSSTIKEILDWLLLQKPFELSNEYKFKFQSEIHSIQNFNQDAVNRLTPDEIEVIKKSAGEDLRYYGYL